jgi:flagellar biosynthesis protein FlhA
LDVAVVNKNPVLLVEAARQGLGRALVHPLLNRDGELRVVTLDSEFEDQLNRAFTGQVSASSDIQPNFVRRVLEGLRSLAGEHVAVATPVLLCATPGRFHLRRLLEPFLPKIVVLSPGEIPPRVQVQSVGVVR